MQLLSSPTSISPNAWFTLTSHPAWVEEEMRNDQLRRISLWSEAIAIGNDDFRENIRRQLKGKNTRGKMVTDDGMTVLKEPHSTYTTLFDDKKMVLSHENSYLWDIT